MCNDDYFDWFLKKLGKPIPETDYADYVDFKELLKEPTSKLMITKRKSRPLRRSSSKIDE